ncbi:unnamed protein product [Rotaria magnacalcarata]
MATRTASNQCLMCPKGEGTCNCAGCKGFFCTQHFIEHRKQLSKQLDDDVVSAHDQFSEKINKIKQSNSSPSALLSKIDQWQTATVEKIQKAAEKAREQVIQLFNKDKETITKRFEQLKKEILTRRETDSFVEHDLECMKENINQLQQDLGQLARTPNITLHIDQGDQIDWNRFIYAEYEQPAPEPALIPKSKIILNVKNPPAGMPKTPFNINEFKRVYSNEDTATKAIPYFWQNFDSTHWSIWLCEYKYPEELTKVFMTCNLISGMFQRLDKLHQNAFSSMCVFGTDNDNTIAGLWFWYGLELVFELLPDGQADYESYKWTRLQVGDEETKQRINQFFLWEGPYNGKAFNQGKIFK